MPMDITPGWEASLPILLNALGGEVTGKNMKCYEELVRMAKLADLYVAEHRKTAEAA